MNDATTRNVVIAGRRTSVRMEQPFWMALDAITDREDVPLNVLLTRIERSLPVDGNMSSAVRVFALSYFFALAQHDIPPGLPAVGAASGTLSRSAASPRDASAQARRPIGMPSTGR